MNIDFSGDPTVVVGAGRGLGRGIAEAFAQAGAPVVAVARTARQLDDLAVSAQPGATMAEAASEGAAKATLEVADASDPATASRIVDTYAPRVLVLVAGAVPVVNPLHHHTWETFSVNWNADVKIAFTWLREALLRPLASGSRIIVVSSGAAVNGSPASGGYAGAKATQRFMSAYAQEESRRAGLGISATAVLPAMTPLGDVGLSGVRAYAARSGRTEEEFVGQMGDLLTPEIAGAALVDLAETDPADIAPAYLLTAAGLSRLQ
jgi:NAD(P)-dependent dehydrogenase (short-subunit alcohol dehydrogenase family)